MPTAEGFLDFHQRTAMIYINSNNRGEVLRQAEGHDRCAVNAMIEKTV